ncbi:unnamed protein product [Angiostrongylus costaricensis]|uniref:Uncharacterized protein n=1 Tax=Angiostrongylus costaricensis TaxID=334426 RepID=A0A0R3PBP5_ANGCS|nr:unnamed protein product [Angiostrongylus costaricensis]
MIVTRHMFILNTQEHPECGEGGYRRTSPPFTSPARRRDARPAGSRRLVARSLAGSTHTCLYTTGCRFT